MREYMRNLAETHRIGLATVQVPTGAGKSFEAAKLIKDLADNHEEHRKIIYLTSLNKNLLDKDLEALYGKDKEGFRTRVLRIRANRDEVVEKILSLEIPESFMTEAYLQLCASVKAYRKAQDGKVRDKSYISDLEKRVDEAESKFRKEVTKRLGREFREKRDRLAAIHTDSNYRWIGELYPAVFTDERQILVMSVSKFLKRNSTIVERSYEFLNADYLNEAIIIIDEFDSTKKVILADIIDRALNMKEDYISLFRQIRHTFVMDDMSRDMREAASRITGSITPNSLIEECSSIWNRYYLGLSYKVSDTDMNHTQNFLIKDGTFHSILQNGAQYIRTAKEDEENRVLINFESKSDFYAKRKEDDIVIYSMLREISSFLNHFRILVYAWGNKYAEIVNSGRRNSAVNGDEMTLESAVDSILSKLGLTDKQKYIITSELCGSIVSRNSQELIQDTSFYQRGMEVFSFKDNDNHNDYTELEFVQILDTPEKILAYLAEKALVIGISATANLPSVVANYDLKYLKEEALGPLFVQMDEESIARIKSELEKKWVAYSDGRISIHAETVKSLKGGFDLDEVCRGLFDTEALCEVAANQIRQMGVSDYYQMRYCNILRTMHAFMKNDCLQSMMYLGMALPKKDSDEMSEDLFHLFEELIMEDLGIKQPFVTILRSDNFDEEKETLLNQLSSGEKRYILSSYQTIGAGQNLQYKCADKSKYVELVPYKNDGDKRHFTKDIDAIYLGDITNKSINTLGTEAIGDEDLINMLVQVEELYSSGELNFKQMEDAMKCAFDARQGKRTTNPLNKTRSVQLLATGYVLQAVGRICRTHIKSPDIYIWIDEELVDALDTRELAGRILPPEMKAILSLKSGLGKVYSTDEQMALNKAEKISSYGNWWIHQKLSRDWSESSMVLWREARNTALMHPTADEGERDRNELVRKLYVTSGTPVSQYLYSQYSDFSDVTIDFGTDAIAFKNSGRAKRKGENDEFVVSTVSAKDSNLYSILKYPGMKEYFEANGFALDFAADKYIMSPVIFHNIYKGALGEVAGKYILEAERGIELHEISDPGKFEYFDYEMDSGVYVDFKNWKFTYAQDREKTLAEISRKMDDIGAKRVYIINIVADEDKQATASIDHRIIEIPALIDEDGYVIVSALDQILREDYET